VILEDLGLRICILGPSNSGKSTLATAIGRSKKLPVVHLDQYRHLPGTQWQLRSDAEFTGLHDAAISGEQWVIDGNYSKLLPQRLARATGFVLLDASAGASLARYLRRTFSDHHRAGGLEGTKDRVSWDMIRYILGTGQSSRRRYRQLFSEVAFPKIFLRNRRALQRFYSQESLQRG
jgi:adenylate kinase family enzyme